MRSTRILTRVSQVALIAASASMIAPLAASAADVLLSGTIVSAAGANMGGVTVSAKPVGGTIRTSVFTDEAGNFYFPPLPEAQYQVTAQAVTFGTGRGNVDLSGNKQANFTLSPVADFVQQLPGDELLRALPAATDEDARMARLVRNNCTGCHTPSYPLQFKFDEAGWTAIIDYMKRVNVSGVYQGPQAKPNGILDTHEKELAAYLARARGPGASSMRFNLRSRPSGEAARVVFKEYDVPINPDSGRLQHTETNDGTDWMLGTPSVLGNMIHDAWPDLDGNLVFTDNSANRWLTIGRIDAKTGAVRPLKVEGPNGFAVATHGLTRDPSGILWFNTSPTVQPNHGGLGRLDPKTDKIDIFLPPADMSGTGGAPTVDFDSTGKIWAGAADGALRFDPQTKEFIAFKSVTQKSPSGTIGRTYGVAGDRNGNGWWAQMMIDTVGHGVAATGQASEVKLQPVKAELDRVTPAEKQFYAGFIEPDFNAPLPWEQGPRRMGTDKNGDVLYVGDSWGGNLARIDINTRETTYIPTPDPVGQQPYHVIVDKNHNAWTNLWTTDQILRYDPAANKWTAFDLPTRGTEARYISLLERDSGTEVVIPEYRPNKIAVMTFRSQADIDALKRQTQ